MANIVTENNKFTKKAIKKVDKGKSYKELIFPGSLLSNRPLQSKIL